MFGFGKEKKPETTLDDIVVFYRGEIARIRMDAKETEQVLRDEVAYYRDAYERLAMSKGSAQEEQAPLSTLEDMADETRQADPALIDAWNQVHGDSYFLAPMDPKSRE